MAQLYQLKIIVSIDHFYRSILKPYLKISKENQFDSLPSTDWCIVGVGIWKGPFCRCVALYFRCT